MLAAFEAEYADLPGWGEWAELDQDRIEAEVNGKAEPGPVVAPATALL